MNLWSNTGPFQPLTRQTFEEARRKWAAKREEERRADVIAQQGQLQSDALAELRVVFGSDTTDRLLVTAADIAKTTTMPYHEAFWGSIMRSSGSWRTGISVIVTWLKYWRKLRKC
jgi:hypothetical protein